MSQAQTSRADPVCGDKRALLRQRLERGEARLHPIAFPQRELWETSPVAVADPANHICAFVEIKGGITFKEAELAIQRVADRQEAMRTSFLPGKERALQMVRASEKTVLGYRELTSAEVQPEAIEEQMNETFQLPFDLLQGPLAGGHVATGGQRSPPGILDPSCHCRRLVVRCLCAGFVYSLRHGFVRPPQSSRSGSDETLE